MKINITFNKSVPSISGTHATVGKIQTILHSAAQLSKALCIYLMVRIEMESAGSTAKEAGKALNVSVNNVSSINSVLAGIAKAENSAAHNCDESALRLLIAKNGDLNAVGSRETAKATNGLDHATVDAARGLQGIQCIGAAMGVGGEKNIKAANTVAGHIGALTAANFAEFFTAYKAALAKPAKATDIEKLLEKLIERLHADETITSKQVQGCTVQMARFISTRKMNKAQSDEVAETLSNIG
jgi:hypothetical protein